MTSAPLNLISFPATAHKLDVGENTLRRMIDRGEFVGAVQVAPRRIGFVEAEVDAWIANRPRGPLPRPPLGKAPVTTISAAPLQEPIK